MEKPLKSRGWRLALGAVTLLFAGIIYAWSVISVPFRTDFGWQGSALTLNFTLIMCFFCLGGLFSGLLSKRVSIAARMTLSAALVLCGFILVARMDGTSYLPLYIGYGFMVGTGIGIVYNTVIATTNAWFPDLSGISSGVLMMGFGFSTLTIGRLASCLFSLPEVGWRATYLILGISVAVVLSVAGFLMKRPAPDTVFPERKKLKNAQNAVEDVPPTEMLRRSSFWRLFVFFILFAAVGSTAISGAKSQFEGFGTTESLAVTLALWLPVCNGIGRIVSGAFFDAFGLRKTQVLTSGVVICATAMTWAGYAFSLNVPGMIGLMLCGFSYGFSPTVSAAFSSAFYGQKNFGINFPILNLILIPASFVPTLLSGYSYPTIFLVLTVFSLVGLVINLSVRQKAG